MSGTLLKLNLPHEAMLLALLGPWLLQSPPPHSPQLNTVPWKLSVGWFREGEEEEEPALCSWSLQDS